MSKGELSIWIKGDWSEKETNIQTKRWVNGQPRQAEDRTYKNTKDLSRQVKGRKGEVDREKNIRKKFYKAGQRPHKAGQRKESEVTVQICGPPLAG